MTVRPLEKTRTPNRACQWEATAVVDGQVYTARSRHGAANALARQLVASAIRDQSLEMRDPSGRLLLTYPSFQKAGEGRLNGTAPPKGANSNCVIAANVHPDRPC
jgi:hypothetical protein